MSSGLRAGGSSSESASVTGSELPTVTVILPIRNEVSFVERSVGTVLARNYPADPLQVLVVDSMSDDGTMDNLTRMLADCPNACRLNNPRRIAPTAMDIGLDRAAGDVLDRIDDYTVITPDRVVRRVKALDGRGADFAEGPMLASEPLASYVRSRTTEDVA